jgi:hypothetical protein
MATIKAEDVRIPRRARDAVAHHEEVVVLNRERPVYVISHPDDQGQAANSPHRGRPLHEALFVLAQLGADDEVGIAAITASELLHGCTVPRRSSAGDARPSWRGSLPHFRRCRSICLWRGFMRGSGQGWPRLEQKWVPTTGSLQPPRCRQDGE